MRAHKLAVAASLLALAGCSTLVTGLRQDLDDSSASNSSPVYGGTFDRGFLAESEPERGAYDRYSAIGHSERAPASKTYPGDAIEHDSWAQNSDERRRDLYRGQGNGYEDEGPATTGNSPSVLPQTRRKYKSGGRATRADFIDESPNEGSLWASDGQTNYYFTKNKTRGVGDIVTVNLEDGMVRDMQLEMRRKLTPGEMAREINNAQMRIRSKVFAGDATDPADLGKDRAPASKEGEGAGPGDAKKKAPIVSMQDREIPVATEADIDLTKSVEIKTGETMLAEILERYPNGAYKIRGTKKVPYKNGAPRLMTMVGVVRGSDISDEDVVASGKLYEYRLDAIR